MKSKYCLGEKVFVRMDNRWVGEYEVAAMICGFENYVLNGKTVYQIIVSGEIIDHVEEERIKINHENNSI